MNLRKTLLIVLSVVLVTAIQAKIRPDGIYEIPKTSVAPVIDGLQDDVWKTLDWNQQVLRQVDGNAGPDDFTDLDGYTKMMWDDNNLYILFYNIDDDIQDNPTQTAGWQKDAVEIMIDGDNSKIADNVAPDPGGGLAPGDYQLTIPHALMGSENPADPTTIGLPATFVADGLDFKISEEDAVTGLGGWFMEIKIPLESLDIIPQEGTQIGIELQQDESDGASGAREMMTKWWNSTNNSWTDASIWGTAELIGRVVSDKLEIPKLAAGKTITVDGVMDEAYKDGYPTGENLFRVDGGIVDNIGEDAYMTTYTLWDDNNIYFFFDIKDDDIQDNPTQTAGWQKDAVELMIDGDNSKIADNVAPDPGGGLAPGDYQLTMPHALMGSENPADPTTIGLPATFVADGLDFKISEKDEGGWNLELKIPLESLDVVPQEGTEIGLELQLDESDGASGQRDAMEKWWNTTNNSWTDASIWGTAVLGGTPTSVKELPSAVITDYALAQNYPNPFNPTTKIRFSIPEAGFVTLKVYNLLGEEIATLINNEIRVGNFETDFDASNLQSGVYFYKLETGKVTITKKMMLLK